jgi:hypothetical protein
MRIAASTLLAMRKRDSLPSPEAGVLAGVPRGKGGGLA